MQARYPTCALMTVALACAACTPLQGGRSALKDAYQCPWGDVAQCEAHCRDDHASSCNNLGEMTEEGAGLQPDSAKAATLYARACRDKDWLGCTNLARLYASGRGAPKDEARAVGLFMSACGQSIAPGCANLHAAHEAGTARWMRRAKSLAPTQDVRSTTLSAVVGSAPCTQMAWECLRSNVRR